MKKILYLLLGLALVVAAILVFNTVMLQSKQVAPQALELPGVPEAAYERLAGAVRFPTVSYSEDAEPDSAAFRGFHTYLREEFPLVHQRLQLDTINQYSLLYTWKGTDASAQPVILMSHQDVVPVDEPTLGDWEAGPFEGRITDSHIIGRGTMDDKGSLMAILESVEMLLAEGFIPKRTFYLAFGHDEEVGGSNGAAKIAAHLESLGIKAAMTLDEGGFLAEGMIPGVDAPVAMVNLAEKGFASFRLIVETSGGHSSQPPRENTIGILAQAIVDLENNQRPYNLVDPITYQFEYLGPELPFLQRMAFANPWLLKKPILKALNAHTTTAPTIIGGGVKNNVIPTVAEATINFRILPGETIESVKAHIQESISDKVRVEPVGFLTNPSPVSEIDSEAYRILEQTIRSAFPDAIVVPGLVGGGTDARYFYGISQDVYRFYPIRIGPDSMTRFHGIDEKISKENYAEMIGFTHALIRALNP
ncbi:M20 family peptidase [Robiginitalea sediminis]|uniref:M20 family peptidase n=1 Tax=Robiginitalea sediminis TaxID=1982593 RepID=UPI000B4B2FA3|nr:M20 family peptidase [Robiginitalea sediminis]